MRPQHACAALDGTRSGPVTEGNVGGGTGMICYGFKGGIGTASRVVKDDAGACTVGVLVQANFGRRDELLVAGVPVGREIPEEPAQPRGLRVTERSDCGTIGCAQRSPSTTACNAERARDSLVAAVRV